MGEEFYVMISGTADVIIEGPGKVHQYDGTAAFGELSLMYNAPRAATIQATSDCAVFSLEKKAFRYILTQTASSSLVQKSKFLKNVPLLAGFSDHMIHKIASALEEEQFERIEKEAIDSVFVESISHEEPAAQAVVTGSIEMWGMAAWPPLPRMTISSAATLLPHLISPVCAL